jgi:hypothetical protein
MLPILLQENHNLRLQIKSLSHTKTNETSIVKLTKQNAELRQEIVEIEALKIKNNISLITTPLYQSSFTIQSSTSTQSNAQNTMIYNQDTCIYEPS